jgi:mannose-1-phosphate guanylyltransferase
MGSRRVAVIMAGGSGTRFWPVSTAARPKQFLRLASQRSSLLEQSVARIAPVVGVDTYVATSDVLLAETRSALPEIDPSRVIGEPAKRNTLGALVWSGAHLIASVGESWRDVSVAVLTADHAISPDDAFVKTVEQAMTLAEASGALVTIGIRPTRPATEFGYIEIGEPSGDNAWKARRFAEKPDAETAESFLASGRYLWNSGMFFWTLGSFVDQLRTANPDAARVLNEVALALRNGDQKAASEIFDGLVGTSVDYALMERAGNVAVVAAMFEWDDLGSWDSLGRGLPNDDHGNAALGSARLIDSERCVVYNDRASQRVTVLGLEDVVVAVTDAEVLVCKKSRAQDVRDLAD